MITINNQRSTIKNQGYISLHVTEIKIQGCISLHVTEMNDLHRMHCISHVISCIISRHFMLHFASFHVIFHTFHRTITYIAHTSRTTRITHFANIEHFMHCTIRRVILCVISYHFLMKFYITLIHTI